MKNINLKSALFFLLGISLATYFALFALQGVDPSFITAIKFLPQVVSIDVIVVSLFSSYAWKWFIFRGWLVPFPNLNGTWKGFINTTWVDPKTGERPASIPAMITVKQSFLNISVVMRTGEMTSRSCTADFILDKENQLCRLCYTYDSNPMQTVKDRSPNHCGTMLFDITGKKQKELEGEYWTGRKSTGNVKLSFWKRKLVDSYPTELGEHPVSAIRDNKS
ncbi:MAG: hypothetical protein EOO43_09615 [Flavobacterium sp.]|nr:MAG: hypothetical protein EOO43_09615 [Flavobacterium sp.]